MSVPSPRLRRETYLLLCDAPRRRLLLSAGPGPLAPPQVPAPAGCGHREAAEAAAGAWWGLKAHALAPVTGHGWASAPVPGGVRTERRLLLATACDPPRSGQGPGGLRWWPLERLRGCLWPTVPSELAEIVEGYWDGWIPDGPLTVEWN
ncbi:hypothetical protein ACFVZ3_39810 [Kitasatospora purpeofusca]|uniref:hypothetical protein n=1 Tax=Kitasatospora purpeofusca TaxID=67352 RepID=UPI003662D8F2